MPVLSHTRAAPFALVLLCLALLTLAPGCSTGPEPRPNIVFIVTDDQAASTFAHMPQLRNLVGEQGLTFENFLINDPICCPSRVTMLLGQYRHNHQLEGDRGVGCAYRFLLDGKHRRAVGALLSEAGVRTGVIGKYLNGYDRYLEQFGPGRGENPLLLGWEDYRVLETHARYVDFAVHENGELRTHESEEAYQTDVLARMATEFIAGAVADDRPFFLYIAPDAVHEPLLPAPRHAGGSVEVGAPRVPSFDEADVSDKPRANRLKRLHPNVIGHIDRRYREALRVLGSVDDLIAAVVRALDEAGVLERSYLFYTSDNGYHYGEHRIPGAKSTPYEESVRVPLLIRGPGVPRGEVRAELAANVDLLPTFLDLLGVERPDGIDGRSLVPLLGGGRGPAAWRRSFALEIETSLRKRNEGIPEFAAIRTDRFKLVEYVDGGRELYDLAQDPYETENLWRVADRELLRALSERLRELLRCSGSDCEQVENLEVPRVAAGP